MKLKDSYSIFILIFALIALAGAVSVLFLGDHNVIEQGAEAIIKAESGIYIDLDYHDYQE